MFFAGQSDFLCMDNPTKSFSYIRR